MRRPIVGVLAEVDAEKRCSVMQAYLAAIESSGGAPFLLPYSEEEGTLQALLSFCDGVLFTGGADISPSLYGEETREACGEIYPYRDRLEMRAFSLVMEKNLPILAICRGAQLVNAALGGTLYQDIPTEYETAIGHRQSEPRYAHSHEVHVLAGTPYHRLIRAERIRANSFHHQAIKTLGRGLSVMAKADDGIVEAVYLEGDRYLRAYQWHPERLCGHDPNHRAIFDDFIEACRSVRR